MHGEHTKNTHLFIVFISFSPSKSTTVLWGLPVTCISYPCSLLEEYIKAPVAEES